jgi:hypothetical protein
MRHLELDPWRPGDCKQALAYARKPTLTRQLLAQRMAEHAANYLQSVRPRHLLDGRNGSPDETGGGWLTTVLMSVITLHEFAEAHANGDWHWLILERRRRASRLTRPTGKRIRLTQEGALWQRRVRLFGNAS